MKKEYKVLAFLKRPNLFFVIAQNLMTLGLIVVALVLMLKGYGEFAVAYMVYALAALFLIYSIYSVIRIIPQAKSYVISNMRRHNITAKILDDMRLRSVVFASFSLLISIGYVIFNGIVAITTLSVWFGALAGYYLLLAILRGRVVLDGYKKKVVSKQNNLNIQRNKLKLYRSCGLVLLITIIALSFAIAQMVVASESFRYAGLMIYVGAVYTFTKVVMSIINFIKAKRRKDITVEAIKNINLADALVSVLALQTAMFQAFAMGENMAFANAATGAVVCALILSIGLLMIIKANKDLRKLKKESANE